MSHRETPPPVSRRKMLGTLGKAALGAAVMSPVLQTAILGDARAQSLPRRRGRNAGDPVNGEAGIDRVVVLPGRTYLRGWAGYGEPPHPGRWRRRRAEGDSTPSAPIGPTPTVRWSKRSGPGRVSFADRNALVTTATFTAPGVYVLELAADNGESRASSTLTVKAELPPPDRQLDVVHTRSYSIDSPLWNHRVKALIVSWIPHCIAMLESTDVQAGGLDNFIEAGKALRGEPHGPHKGYVFADAYVHNAVEAMSIALMVNPKGDPEIVKAQDDMRATLERWIPIILAAQEPDGYMQTAFTLPRTSNRGGNQEPGPFLHWTRRHDHEGYTAGYFLEAAMVHYGMTDLKDPRLYDAAKKLADCWCDNLGPAPKKAWYDGHEEMEQALVRFGRFVNDTEGKGKGDRYIDLAKFLLDNRYYAAKDERERSEYDQSHLPVKEQYEAVGHAVRAVYCYSGMADVAMETHDPDYRSAVKSLWENIVNRKYYVTGGIASGETSEGFGPDYSLRNDAYCESCSGCGEIFFQWKLNLIYHDAKFADLYEETVYNALLGGLSMDGKTFYYPNPLDARRLRTSWHSVPCCTGNIPRTLLAMPTWIYAKSPDGVYVNLFVGSTVELGEVGGTRVQMVQKTNYPWDGKVAITVNPAASKRFRVRVRVPNRSVSELYASTPEANGITSLAVNGSPVKQKIENGYAVIDRTWKKGDIIELELPMKIQRIRAIDEVEADRGKVALRYGPLIYNIEKVDVADIGKVLPPDAPLATEWRGDLLNGVMVIKGRFADGSPMLAIPNYARMNREPEPPPRPAESAPTSGGQRERPAPPPIASVVWINERSG
ncbi:MAG TPA: beta-L-arabinofuranosidase domain-containing protein [Gemmatimonadaceae bacterium]|nr:beta-L-arabinofuranosidase domain-containing protein [Gemmatimonadaceae bacterium]